MKRDELFPFLSDYAKMVNLGTATTKDFTDIKNKIRQTYDAGNLDKESMSDLGKKASHNFKNMGKATELQEMVPKIIEKGGQVGKLEEAFQPAIGKVFRSGKNAASSMAKKAGKGLKSFAPLLGMLGKALPIAGTAAGLASGDVFAADPTGMLQTEELGKGSDVLSKPVMTQSPKSNAAYSGEQLANEMDFPKLDELASEESTKYKTDKFRNLKNKLAGTK